jgi:hypothetical protein
MAEGLGDDNVDARVQQVGGEGVPQDVGGQGEDARVGGEFVHELLDGPRRRPAAAAVEEQGRASALHAAPRPGRTLSGGDRW